MGSIQVSYKFLVSNKKEEGNLKNARNKRKGFFMKVSTKKIYTISESEFTNLKGWIRVR